MTQTSLRQRCENFSDFNLKIFFPCFLLFMSLSVAFRTGFRAIPTRLLGSAPLQLGARSHTARHCFSLLCSPSGPRNIAGLGLGVPFKTFKTRSEAGFSLAGCRVYHTTLKVDAACPGARRTRSLGSRVGANFHQLCWQWEHLHLPGAGPEFQALTKVSMPLFSVPLSLSRRLGMQIETEKSEANVKKARRS